MGAAELKEMLKPFRAKCAEKGKALTDMCIEEAYPGDASTPFIVQVKAPWIDSMLCYDVLDFLFDTLWETADEDVRRKIFSIRVLNSKDELHCHSDSEFAVAS